MGNDIATYIHTCMVLAGTVARSGRAQLLRGGLWLTITIKMKLYNHLEYRSQRPDVG